MVIKVIIHTIVIIIIIINNNNNNNNKSTGDLIHSFNYLTHEELIEKYG